MGLDTEKALRHLDSSAFCSGYDGASLLFLQNHSGGRFDTLTNLHKDKTMIYSHSVVLVAP
jgi:hypothetical protein